MYGQPSGAMAPSKDEQHSPGITDFPSDHQKAPRGFVSLASIHAELSLEPTATVCPCSFVIGKSLSQGMFWWPLLTCLLAKAGIVGGSQEAFRAEAHFGAVRPESARDAHEIDRRLVTGAVESSHTVESAVFRHPVFVEAVTEVCDLVEQVALVPAPAFRREAADFIADCEWCFPVVVHFLQRLTSW